MKLDIGWVEVVIALTVVALSIGGSYVPSAYEGGKLEQRVIHLEEDRKEIYPILKELSKGIGDLNTTLARMDERMKALEK